MTGPESVRSAPATVLPAAPQPAGGFPAALGESVRFSSHAAARIQQRGLTLTAERPTLSVAMDALSQAGSTKAAIVTTRGTYIVAPQSRTVITALNDGGGLQLVTNIDALVVMGRTSMETPHSGPTEGMPSQTAPHWSLVEIPQATK